MVSPLTTTPLQMAENHDLAGALPPGWDRKYDPRTGRYYFINYFNKTSTWEDPRMKYKQLQQSQQIPTEPCQSAHGSPDIRGYHIYPANCTPLQPQHAFQSPSRALLLQDRTGVIKTQDTLPGLQPPDMDLSVVKIGAMFPTVSETHIRTLLIKYHQREAVVVSALQVEKHPLSTPGPVSARPLHSAALHVCQALQMTPPRHRQPHSSPKMKLRYLKSVFPKAEEMMLLDILSSTDDNVQKATEQLLSLGFEKRDTPPPRLTLSKRDEEQRVQRTQTAAAAPPRVKTADENNIMRTRLQTRYKDIADRLVTFALESVDYDEDRASTILEMMKREEQQQQLQQQQLKLSQHTPRIRLASAASAVVALNRESKQSATAASKKDGGGGGGVGGSGGAGGAPPTPKDDSSKIKVQSSDKTISISKPSNGHNGDKNNNHRRSKANKTIEKVSRGTSTSEDKEEYRSPYQCKSVGPNRAASRGPNDQLLLVDYMTWNGPNPELVCGRAGLAKGHGCLAKGPNPDLRKGPVLGLALGPAAATGIRRHCCEKLITACMRG